MRAAILRSPEKLSGHTLSIDEVAIPVAKPGFVRLKVHACGVCRTDLHIVEGELQQRLANLTPGHQIVGSVVEPGMPALPAGRRVGVSWIGGVDGQCFYCRRG